MFGSPVDASLSPPSLSKKQFNFLKKIPTYSPRCSACTITAGTPRDQPGKGTGGQVSRRPVLSPRPCPAAGRSARGSGFIFLSANVSVVPAQPPPAPVPPAMLTRGTKPVQGACTPRKNDRNNPALRKARRAVTQHNLLCLRMDFRSASQRRPEDMRAGFLIRNVPINGDKGSRWALPSTRAALRAITKPWEGRVKLRHKDELFVRRASSWFSCLADFMQFLFVCLFLKIT